MVQFYHCVYDYARRYLTSGTLYRHAYCHAWRYNHTRIRNIIDYMKIPRDNIKLSACIWL